MDIDLKEWSLVLLPGVQVVGKVKDRRLAPVFQLHTPVLGIGDGQANQAIFMTPFVAVGVGAIQIPHDTPIVPLTDCYPVSHEILKNQIRAQLAIAQQQRLARLGLVTSNGGAGAAKG